MEREPVLSRRGLLRTAASTTAVTAGATSVAAGATTTGAGSGGGGGGSELAAASGPEKASGGQSKAAQGQYGANSSLFSLVGMAAVGFMVLLVGSMVGLTIYSIRSDRHSPRPYREE